MSGGGGLVKEFKISISSSSSAEVCLDLDRCSDLFIWLGSGRDDVCGV